ncbi:MAG: hypothetical protein MUP81_03845 [Dehalococcoidia bacterium]|nr:hypothetical protein [Dehalococcoidia bacterium]
MNKCKECDKEFTSEIGANTWWARTKDNECFGFCSSAHLKSYVARNFPNTDLDIAIEHNDTYAGILSRQNSRRELVK